MRRLAKLALMLLASAPFAALAQDPPVEGQPVPADPAPAPEPVPTDTPAEPPPPAKKGSPVNVVYDKKTTFTTDDDAFKLQISLRSQLRFETARTLADDEEFTSRFTVPRGRLTFEGHAFHDVGYKAQIDIAGNGNVNLKDLYLDPRLGGIKVRVGQFKRPTARQQITSSGNLVFVERTPDDGLVSGRDLGVMVHNDFEKVTDGLEWAVGLFNGQGERARQTITCTLPTDPADPPVCTVGAPTNVAGDWLPTVAARVGWAAGGIKQYSQADLEGGGLRWAVAAQYRGAGLADFDTLVHTFGVDGIVKVAGFDASFGAFAIAQDGADTELLGHLQAGYMVLPKKAHVAARIGVAPVGGEDQIDARGAFNWFFSGHEWKWSTDLGIVQVTGGGDPDLQLRTQLQLTI